MLNLRYFILRFILLVIISVISVSADNRHPNEFEETHWDHITIRRLIEQRIQKKEIVYTRPDNTEHGHALRLEWGNEVKQHELDNLGRKVCKTTTCRRGQCVFAGCSNPTSCTGGKCTFVDCERPSCTGGKCRFIGCHHPTCGGGLCRFELTNTTLRTGFCNGGACSIDGVPARNDMNSFLAE
jgi:hypothetical protein